MTVFIVGLGLIGASYAERLTQQGYQVFGFDQDEQVSQQALSDGVIKSASLASLNQADLIISALYPNSTKAFIETNKHLFKSGAIFTDVSGVKQSVFAEVEALLPSDVSYISHHPMAGKATPGYGAKDPNMFDGKNAIVIESPQARIAQKTIIETMLKALGFATITHTSAAHHDELIAHTSQLPHILAMTLIDINKHQDVMRYTGNSYRDLTRIASINERLWSELFFANKNALIGEIDQCIASLQTVKSLIESDQDNALQTWMQAVKQKRDDYENH